MSTYGRKCSHWGCGRNARRNSYCTVCAKQMLFEDATSSTSGVMRWKSNGHVVPRDILEDANLDPDILAACERARMRELEEWRRQAIKAENEMDDDARAERAFEMRAAFGEGQEVVNIITGRRYRT